MASTLNLVSELKQRLDEAGIWDREMALRRNEYLKVKGEADTNVYFIVEGSLRAYIDDHYEEHTIRLGYRDNFIVSLDSFISKEPSDLYIQALKKCRLLVINRQQFQQFIESAQEHLRLWHRVMEQLIYQQLEREKDILIRSPKDRYERVLARSPVLFREIPLRHIASYLRMTPETLSRLRKS